jgi:hypothetical protein
MPLFFQIGTFEFQNSLKFAVRWCTNIAFPPTLTVVGAVAIEMNTAADIPEGANNSQRLCSF